MNEGNEGGNQIYSHKPLSIPSLVIINEFMVCTYNTIHQTNFDFGSVLSIDRKLVKEVLNFKESILKIGLLKSRKQINDSLINQLASKLNQNIGNLYREVVFQAKGVILSNTEIQEFIKEVALDESDLFDKLKPEYLAMAMKKHFDNSQTSN